MTYGAKESNSREAVGLALFISGLVAWVAGWAYGSVIAQVVFVILGLIGIVAGLLVLRAARAAG